MDGRKRVRLVSEVFDKKDGEIIELMEDIAEKILSSVESAEVSMTEQINSSHTPRRTTKKPRASRTGPIT